MRTVNCWRRRWERPRRRASTSSSFPELSLTGYFLKDMVPEVADPAQHFAPMKEIAALSRNLSLVVGFVEESGRHGFFNSAAYFENGELLHVHRKVYLPTYGLFDENRYVGRGDKVRAFDTRFGRAAILICEDAWHPSLAGVASLDGADLLIVPLGEPRARRQQGERRGRPRDTARLAVAHENLRRGLQPARRLQQPRGL